MTMQESENPAAKMAQWEKTVARSRNRGIIGGATGLIIMTAVVLLFGKQELLASLMAGVMTVALTIFAGLWLGIRRMRKKGEAYYADKRTREAGSKAQKTALWVFFCLGELMLLVAVLYCALTGAKTLELPSLAMNWILLGLNYACLGTFLIMHAIFKRQTGKKINGLPCDGRKRFTTNAAGL